MLCLSIRCLKLIVKAMLDLGLSQVVPIIYIFLLY